MISTDSGCQRKLPRKVNAMTTLTVELPTELYEHLRAEAEHVGEPVQSVVRRLLAERLMLPLKSISERERVTDALRKAGLLAELGPEMKKRAAQSTMTLTEVQAALDAAGGPPLSEVILAMRGPKE